MILREFIFTISLVAFASTPVSAADGTIVLRARNSADRLAVTASMHLEGPITLDLRADETGRVAPRLPIGEYRIEVAAEGFESMRSHFAVEEINNLPITFALSPSKAAAPDPEFTARLREGSTLVTGSVVDDETGRPIRGAKVQLERTGLETTTDAKGQYFISIRTPPIVNDLPTGVETIVVQMPGYKAMIYRDILIASEVAGADFSMEKGSGLIEESRRHKLMEPGPSRQSNP